MRQMMKAALILILTVLLAACGGNGDGDDTVPTLIQLNGGDVVEEDPTSVEASAEGEEAPPMATETQRPFERPTLPPSWTPEPTNTPLPTRVPNTPVPTLEILNPPQECGLFGPDTLESDETIRLGESPLAAWRPIDSARLYRLVVLDSAGNQVYDVLTDRTVHRIPADTFVSAVRYGWEVMPLDNVGIQICPSRGARLNVRP